MPAPPSQHSKVLARFKERQLRRVRFDPDGHDDPINLPDFACLIPPGNPEKVRYLMERYEQSLVTPGGVSLWHPGDASDVLPSCVAQERIFHRNGAGLADAGRKDNKHACASSVKGLYIVLEQVGEEAADDDDC